MTKSARDASPEGAPKTLLGALQDMCILALASSVLAYFVVQHGPLGSRSIIMALLDGAAYAFIPYAVIFALSSVARLAMRRSNLWAAHTNGFYGALVFIAFGYYFIWYGYHRIHG